MRHAYSLAIAALAVAGLQLVGLQANRARYTKVEPAKVEKGDGINKLTLTEKAMERLAVETAPRPRRQRSRAPENDAAAAVRSVQRADVRVRTAIRLSIQAPSLEPLCVRPSTSTTSMATWPC